MKIQPIFILLFLLSNSFIGFTQNALYSIETGKTISNVRIATNGNSQYIIANSFEGTVMGIDYDSTILWQNELSGYMNYDLWCEDITGDGNDEIFAANADGNLYCLDDSGNIKWQFQPSETPMFSVCVIEHNSTKYVICGSFDKNIYYLTTDGSVLKIIASDTYSIEKPWGENKPDPDQHIANFLRPIKKADGTQDLLVHGCINQRNTNGGLYFFEPLKNSPYKIEEALNNKPIGDLKITNFFGAGQEQILMGSSTHDNDAEVSRFEISTTEKKRANLASLNGQLNGKGYRVIQTEVIPKGNSYEYFVLSGANIFLIPPDFELNNVEILHCDYAFFDMWRDAETDRIILASSQSGGSAIHVIDYTNPNLKTDFENLSPPGKIQKILDNTSTIRNHLADFQRPDWEREPLPVYFVSDLSTNNNVNTTYSVNLADEINSNYNSPIIVKNLFMKEVQDPLDWNRDTMSNAVYRDKRDVRKTYNLTQNEVMNKVVPHYNNGVGLSYWGGHGQDPFFFSLKTTKALLDANQGKKTVLIYPEITDYSSNFDYVTETLFYPLAEYARTRNTQIHIRSKHAFWFGDVYLSNWAKLAAGEYADIFVPTMEETEDKSMELSIAGRMGFWASGAVNEWGTRGVLDNAGYNRIRQHAYQRLPDHHLRQVIYALSSGATHINNFIVDTDYMSLAWELVAKGALFIPKKSEILSISPVHLSMTSNPDPYFLEQATYVKWLVNYDKDFVENNKLVFDRLNGTWMGAPVNEWDFSSYAANEKERRLNFIPAYNNGLVLITPVQEGYFAKTNVPRGKLIDHLHPIYKDIMTEYITDGRNYYSADSSETYAPEVYFNTIKTEIEEKAKLLPLTVEGDIGWVVAQTDKRHLRLTIIDGGWINPSDKTATISFHTVTPFKMTDILDNTTFDVSNPANVSVDIPCGMFRFIDIELGEDFINSTNENIVDVDSFHLYPNPAIDELTIEFYPKNKTTQFQIFDLSGRLVYQETKTSTPNIQNIIQLDISDLGDGSYIVQWAEGKQSKKFVKSSN